jgi:hypothetical protein
VDIVFEKDGWLVSSPAGVVSLAMLVWVLTGVVKIVWSIAREGFGVFMQTTWTKGKAKADAIEVGFENDPSGKATTVFMIWHLWAAIYSFALFAFFVASFLDNALAMRDGQTDLFTRAFCVLNALWSFLCAFRGFRAVWRMNSVYCAAWPELNKGTLNTSFLKFPLA